MANRTNVGGWLQGKTVRKGGIPSTSQHTARSNTPQVQSTSTTIFGGGVKDASGRTSEFFVSAFSLIVIIMTSRNESTVDGRRMSGVQVR